MAYASITKPSLHFNTNLFTSNGSETSQTGLGFRPDLVWNKSRSAINSHVICNSVSGTGKFLASNNTDAETTATGTVSSFDSDGFTFSADSGGYGNTNGRTYANWCWKAGGSGSANTDGTINSTVSVNTTAGFSIVTYTGNATNGATVGHGLGVAPKVVIIKNKAQNNTGWVVGHDSLGWTKYLQLNTTGPETTDNVFNNAAPTSSVFAVVDDGKVNSGAGSHIAYCFAEKQGYSKFGSYIGNGNADGAFVYTGFKPAFVIFKATHSTTSESWLLLDTVRQPSNVNNRRLRPDTNSAEDTPSANNVDLLSNGFKIRSSDNRLNGSGHPLIYMAFASEPLVANVGSSIPATAR